MNTSTNKLYGQALSCSIWLNEWWKAQFDGMRLKANNKYFHNLPMTCYTIYGPWTYVHMHDAKNGRFGEISPTVTQQKWQTAD